MRESRRIAAARVGSALASVALCLFAACSAVPVDDATKQYPPLEVAELGLTDHCFRCGDLYLVSAPNGDVFELAARRGFKLVIDLRADAQVREAAMARDVRRMGLEYECVAIEPGALDPTAVDFALDLIAAATGPVLLFCDTGARTATLFAVHRAAIEGVDIEAALADGRFAGMKPGTEGEVRAQVVRLRNRTAVSACATSASPIAAISASSRHAGGMA